MSIIMFAGKTKSGKSTAAEALVSLNPTYKQVAFGDIIKEDYCNRYNVPIEYLHDVTKKDFYRPDVVQFADEQRAKDQYRYARGLFTMLDAYPGNYVVDDLRAVEELEFGLARGATPHLIHAEDVPRKFRGWVPNDYIDQHYLENEMILSAETYRALSGTVIYNNSQSLDDIRNRMEALLRELAKRELALAS